MFRKKVRRMLETGIARDRIAVATAGAEPSQVRVMWLSWLDHIKAPELILRGFAAARQQDRSLALTLVGSGPLESKLHALAAELGVAEAVSWSGRVPHTEVLRLMAEHQIFVFTSLRDTSGNVLLEAMAAGLPAVTLRHHGAAEIATDDTAIRIVPHRIDQTIADIGNAIVRLARTPETRRAFGQAAQSRIAEIFAWDQKARQMSAIYREVVDAGRRGADTSGTTASPAGACCGREAGSRAEG